MLTPLALGELCARWKGSGSRGGPWQWHQPRPMASSPAMASAPSHGIGPGDGINPVPWHSAPSHGVHHPGHGIDAASVLEGWGPPCAKYWSDPPTTPPALCSPAPSSFIFPCIAGHEDKAAEAAATPAGKATPSLLSSPASGQGLAGEQGEPPSLSWQSRPVARGRSVPDTCSSQRQRGGRRCWAPIGRGEPQGAALLLARPLEHTHAFYFPEHLSASC